MLLNKSFITFLNYNFNSIFNNILFQIRKIFFKLYKSHYYYNFDKKTVNPYTDAENINKFSYKGINLNIYKLKNIKIYSYLGLITDNKSNPINVYDKKIFLKKKKLRFYMPFILKNRSTQIKGNSIFFCNPGRNVFNYFHFIIDLGTQLFIFKKKKIKLNNLILFSKRNLNRENFIKYFYPRLNFIYCKKNEIITVENLIVLNSYYFSKYLGKKLSKLFIEYKNFIKKKLKSKKNFNPSKTIFINRHESRKIVNMSFFRKNIKLKEIFFSSFQNLKQQSAIIQNSCKIIGLHGAGMTNIIFAHKKACVVELIPSYYPNSCFEDLCKTLGLKYKKIILKQNLSNKNLLSQKDINEIKKI